MKIAITGGIGAGKSYVCQALMHRAISVYDCDEAAKRLMRESGELRNALSTLVGADLYRGEVLDKAMLARFILQGQSNKTAVENIVHPAVAHDFICSGLDWLESAILFESSFNHRINLDYVVCVTAPLAVRVARITHRDNISEACALDWINAQMSQEEKANRSDFIIYNDGQSDIDQQLDTILSTIKYN